MDNNIIIVDEYVSKIGLGCKIKGAEILDNTIFTEYISTLKAIKASAIKNGDIADALDAYIDCAEMMKSKLADISESMKIICDSFIAEVDEKDQYIF